MSAAYEDIEPPRGDWLRGLLNRILHVLVVLAVAILMVCWFLPLLRERQKQQAALQDLERQVEQQRTLLNKQTKRLNLLQGDRSYLEVLARDKLDLQKPGESIFRMDQGSDGKP